MGHWGSSDDRSLVQWPKVPLNEITDLTLSSVDKKSKANEKGVQLCNYMDVYSNSFISENLKFMEATATEREIANCSLFAGDVVITKDSEQHDDIGVPALVREDIPGLVCGYHLAILRPRSPAVDGAYLFYGLNDSGAQQQFHSYANGVTRFGLRKADIGLVEISLPPLPEQRRIADILGALDDKIELNRRMNETLEQMARALYKSWFVDFDPVRAKMDGRWRRGESLPGLPSRSVRPVPRPSSGVGTRGDTRGVGGEHNCGLGHYRGWLYPKHKDSRVLGTRYPLLGDTQRPIRTYRTSSAGNEPQNHRCSIGQNRFRLATTGHCPPVVPGHLWVT